MKLHLIPKTVDSPGIGLASGRVCVPELREQDLAAGGVEAAGVLDGRGVLTAQGQAGGALGRARRENGEGRHGGHGSGGHGSQRGGHGDEVRCQLKTALSVSDDVNASQLTMDVGSPRTPATYTCTVGMPGRSPIPVRIHQDPLVASPLCLTLAQQAIDWQRQRRRRPLHKQSGRATKFGY